MSPCAEHTLQFSIMNTIKNTQSRNKSTETYKSSSLRHIRLVKRKFVDILGQRPWPDILTIWLKPWNSVWFYIRIWIRWSHWSNTHHVMCKNKQCCLVLSVHHHVPGEHGVNHVIPCICVDFSVWPQYWADQYIFYVAASWMTTQICCIYFVILQKKCRLLASINIEI